MLIRDLDASQFSHLSALLDEALSLPAPERDTWLEGIATHDRESAELLCRLLAGHAMGSDAWLEMRSLSTVPS